MNLERVYNFVEIAGFYPSSDNISHKNVLVYLINNCPGISNISNYYSHNLGTDKYYFMSKIFNDFYSFSILSDKSDENLYIYSNLDRDLGFYNYHFDLINEVINPFEHEFLHIGKMPILNLETSISNLYNVLYVKIPFQKNIQNLK